MFRKVLLPLDGSRLSETIIPYAGQLAAGLGARVTILYATGASAGDKAPATVTRVPEGTSLSAKAFVQEAEALVKQQGVAQVDSQVVSGAAASEIVRVSESNGYDLIAMATHGRSGVGRWVFGSTADKVLHTSALPLLLLRPKDPATAPLSGKPIGSVLLPLDGSTLAEKVIPIAESVAKKLDLPVNVLRVVPSVGMLYAGFEPYAYDPTLDKDLEKFAGQYLKNVTEGFQRQGIRVTGYQRRGYSAAQIIGFSEELGNTLIVMSTHGRSGMGRWLLGSVADRVVRSSAQPVLLVRPKGEPPAG